MNHGGKTCKGRAQHHALGAKVHNAGFFVDEQAKRRNGQYSSGAERGGQQQGGGIHQ